MFDVSAAARHFLAFVNTPLSIFTQPKIDLLAQNFFKEPPPSPHFVAHLFSGRYLQGSVLEGSQYPIILETLLPYLKYFATLNPTSPAGKLSAEVIPHFEELQEQAKILQKAGVSQSEKQLLLTAKNLHTKIHSLKPGTSYLMLGGWTGSLQDRGHAMLYEFTKNRRGLFDLCLIAPETACEQDPTTPLLRFLNLDKDKLSPLFFKALLEPRVIPLWNPENETDWLSSICTAIGSVATHTEVTSIQVPTKQADTCTMDTLIAYIYYKGGNKIGSQLHDMLELTVLSHVWKAFKPEVTPKDWQDADARESIALAEMAAQILLSHNECCVKDQNEMCYKAQSLSSEILSTIDKVKEAGIAHEMTEQIYTEEKFPKFPFHRYPHHVLAPHHTNHLLHSYSHYLLLEHRNTKEKLLVLPILPVEKKEPLSSVVTPLITNGPYCALECIDGIWQGKTPLANLYLGYLFLSMREYSKAMSYFQKIKLPLEEREQAQQILKWIRNVNDQSDEKHALLFYAEKKLLCSLSH